MDTRKTITFEFRQNQYELAFEKIALQSGPIIYSADIGGYSGNDAILSMAARYPGRQFIFFTDRPVTISSGNLKIVSVDWTGRDERLVAKYFKVNSATIFNQHHIVSLWVDSNVEMIDDTILNRFDSHGLQLLRHDKRTSISQELQEIVKHGKESKERAHQAAISLARQTHDIDRLPLYQGRIIFRRTEPQIIEFEKLWWAYILSTTYRDQISLPVAIEVSGVSANLIDAEERKKYFVIHPHKKYKFNTLEGGAETKLKFLLAKIRFKLAITLQRFFKRSLN